MIDPGFHAKIQEIVDQQGWDDNTVLDLALNYIANQQDDEAFLDHLREIQSEGEGAATDGWVDHGLDDFGKRKDS